MNNKIIKTAKLKLSKIPAFNKMISYNNRLMVKRPLAKMLNHISALQELNMSIKIQIIR